MRITPVALLTGLLALAVPARAQSIDTVGTRAQGMGGAFVAVADDASAVYWNPAGLAGGAYFSLVLDGSASSVVPDDAAEGASRNGWLLALSTPPLGLSYTRLESTTIRPASGIPESSHVESLVTQHVGVTFVQTLFGRLAVGGTAKLVRGIAAAADVQGTDREDILDHLDLMGNGTNRGDLDVGVMAVGTFGALGLTVRNVTAPTFDTGTGEELGLQRQVRGGGSLLLLPSWKVAGDVDLLETETPFGDLREVAFGTEGKVGRRMTARAGFRFNAGDGSNAPAFSVGGSYAVAGSVQIDGQYTGGSDQAFRGWGIAGRMVF